MEEPITLRTFAREAEKDICTFMTYWEEKNKENPDEYPEKQLMTNWVTAFLIYMESVK